MANKNSESRFNAAKDLQDSADDRKKMRAETANINLPDIKDIPGQENVRPMPLGELADDTISSSDEEGDALFDEDLDEEIDEDPDSNVSQAEKNDLEISASDMPTQDDINLREAALDNTDEDGTPLNEGGFKSNLSGTDLDVPGAEDDDEDEEIGEEDEENNDYSLGGDNHDDIPQDNA